MHTYILQTILLAQCHSNMFRTSKGHLQGVRLTYFQSQFNKICSGCKINCMELCVLC